jgi:hypothetical protein
MRRTAAVIVFWLLALCWAASAGAQTAELRIGIIGTDTSHVTAFTRLLNDKNDPGHIPGARVVAAFKGGSPDVEASRTRVDGFAAELRDKWSVELVDSIDALCAKVDAVMKSDYRSLLVEIVKFFQTGAPPVPPEETLEIIAFMEATELSKTRGGAPVALTDVTQGR